MVISRSSRDSPTGVTGQDGSYLTEFLLAKGYEVHGIIRRSSSFNTGRIEHIYKDRHDQGKPGRSIIAKGFWFISLLLAWKEAAGVRDGWLSENNAKASYFYKHTLALETNTNPPSFPFFSFPSLRFPSLPFPFLPPSIIRRQVLLAPR